MKTKSDILSGLLKGSFWEWSVFVFCLVAVIVLIWLVIRVRAWLRDDTGSTAGHIEMWKQLKDLKQQGHLSDEEFRSINSRVVNPEMESFRQNDESSPSSS
ncbi:hypothetical protein MNBD_PLANCTO02-2427 [hydrothermal vent metagenome]|uniref:SHOCT domain-containing protein n=1 Tax=hydrothermal vent metagenome TaxID=652676 RepID=A0A3B1E8G7_9ZZZZ